MIVDPFLDPEGAVIVELRTYLIAHGWPQVVVKGDAFTEGEIPPEGPVGGAILVRQISGAPRRRVPLQTTRYVLMCMVKPAKDGATRASALAQAATAGMHDIGPRIASGSRPLFSSYVISYGGDTTDPDLKWPRSDRFLEVLSGTHALA